MKPQVFIASSKEGLSVAGAIQSNLISSEKVFATLWNQDIFKLSHFTLHDLVNQVNKWDFVIFILTPDDIASIRGGEHKIARDNLYLELGLFIGGLGLDRCFVVIPDSISDFHLPTDILGLTVAKYIQDPRGNLLASLNPVCMQICSAIEKKHTIPDFSMRIGISGSMSVGKRTLIKNLTEKLRVSGFPTPIIYGDAGRMMIKEGKKADKETAFEDYPGYIRYHLTNMINRDNGLVFYDRTIFDTIAYAETNGNFGGDWIEMAREVGRLCSNKFDLYFYIPVEESVPLVNDGVRSTDHNYRLAIDISIIHVLRRNLHNITELRGSIDDRVNKAFQAIVDCHRVK